MSIYGGFATRNQETFYNKLIEKLVQLLSLKIVATYNGKLLPDEKLWAKKVLKVHKSLAYMEQSKYLEPKMSFSFDNLAAILRVGNSMTDSTHMSNISALDKLSVKLVSGSSARKIETKSSRNSKFNSIIKLKITAYSYI